MIEVILKNKFAWHTFLLSKPELAIQQKQNIWGFKGNGSHLQFFRYFQL